MTTVCEKCAGKRAPRKVWWVNVIALIVATAAAALTPVVVERQTGSPVVGDTAGLAVITGLTFLGLTARGLGELRGGPGYKSAGYFFGAVAVAFAGSFAGTGGF